MRKIDHEALVAIATIAYGDGPAPRAVLPAGIRRKRGGWQAYVKIRGTTYTQQFRLGTPLVEMRAWREKQKKQFGGVVATAGSVAADVNAYLKLPTVAAMPSI